MHVPLRFVHSFGSQDMDMKIIPNEFVDDSPGDSVVEVLLGLTVEVKHIVMLFH